MRGIYRKDPYAEKVSKRTKIEKEREKRSDSYQAASLKRGQIKIYTHEKILS